jgi:hypothetical protein
MNTTLKLTLMICTVMTLAVTGCQKDTTSNNNNTPTRYNYTDLAIDAGNSVRYGRPTGGDNIIVNGEELGGGASGYSIIAHSSFYDDDTKASGLTFEIVLPASAIDGNGAVIPGTYTFYRNQVTNSDGSVVAFVRLAAGAIDYAVNAKQLTSGYKQTRGGSPCVSTDVTADAVILTITKWTSGTTGEKEGTFTGTFYENYRTLNSCSPSEPHTFSGSFKSKGY